MASPTFSPRLFRAHCIAPSDYFDRAPRSPLDPLPAPAPRGLTEGQKCGLTVAGIVAASVAAAFAESFIP